MGFCQQVALPASYGMDSIAQRHSALLRIPRRDESAMPRRLTSGHDSRSTYALTITIQPLAEDKISVQIAAEVERLLAKLPTAPAERADMVNSAPNVYADGCCLRVSCGTSL